MIETVCIKGHTYNGKKCIECKKEYAKSYYKLNREKIRQKQTKYRQENLEKVREISRNSRKRNIERCKKAEARWYQENKEKKRQSGLQWREKNYKNFRKKQKEWYKQNIDKYNFYVAKRRSIKIKATPPWLKKQHFEQISFFYKEAKRLQELDGIKRHVDHIVPLINKNICGLHVPWNLQILTAEENLRKFNKYE